MQLPLQVQLQLFVVLALLTRSALAMPILDASDPTKLAVQRRSHDDVNLDVETRGCAFGPGCGSYPWRLAEIDVNLDTEDTPIVESESAPDDESQLGTSSGGNPFKKMSVDE
ncbi:hypothetical protein BCR39DRAFT_317975 [Naematelia encephala]|uniref:Uncharacterized protein n=1 Tax=Naematelia encephala TaxID=71784 RepID=A0A1Y2AQB8_9TREE|nr:hypothetical protein BCR39DRAFT_317975 [Naematelia encephala]